MHDLAVKWCVHIDMNEIVLLLFALAIKHGVCDLALQALYCRPSNKHIFLSPRAMMHSLHHGVGAWIVLIPFTNYLTAITLAILDGFSHHIIDFCKSTLVKSKNWTMDGKMYWVATTVDQNLHFSVYLLIAYLGTII